MEKKILIAVPCMDSVAVGFCESLATLKKVGNCKVAFKVGSLIYASRNELAKIAVKEEYDYIVWFDSDMVFEPDTLQRLVKHLDEGKDIISGIYFRRAMPYTPVLFKWLDPNSILNSWQGYDDYPKNSVFEIAGMGFGCVAMKTDVLLDTGESGQWFTPIKGFGEDLSFCIRAKEKGYKIWCDSSIKLGHTSHSIVNEEFYEVFRESRK